MTLKTVAGLIANALVAWARLTIIPFCSPSCFAVVSLVDAGAARSLFNPDCLHRRAANYLAKRPQMSTVRLWS